MDANKGSGPGMGAPLNFHGNFNGQGNSKDIENSELTINMNNDPRNDESFDAVNISTPGTYVSGSNA